MQTDKKYFKNSSFEAKGKFSYDCMILKIVYTYVKLCQESIVRSGFPWKNQFWVENGQKYLNTEKKIEKIKFLRLRKNFLT